MGYDSYSGYSVPIEKETSVSKTSEKFSQLSDPNLPSVGFIDQILDSAGGRSRTAKNKPSLSEDEFFQAFNEAWPAISRDHVQVTKQDIDRYKHDPFRLQATLNAQLNPGEANRVAMLNELSDNFYDLKGLSRATWGVGDGVRREDVHLFHELYRARTQGGGINQNSDRERTIYQNTVGRELGGEFIGLVGGSLLGAEAGAFLSRGTRVFLKTPAMLIGATVFSLAGMAIGDEVVKSACSYFYKNDNERLNRLMGNFSKSSTNR